MRKRRFEEYEEQLLEDLILNVGTNPAKISTEAGKKSIPNFDVGRIRDRMRTKVVAEFIAHNLDKIPQPRAELEAEIKEIHRSLEERKLRRKLKGKGDKEVEESDDDDVEYDPTGTHPFTLIAPLYAHSSRLIGALVDNQPADLDQGQEPNSTEEAQLRNLIREHAIKGGLLSVVPSPKDPPTEIKDMSGLLCFHGPSTAYEVRFSQVKCWVAFPYTALARINVQVPLLTVLLLRN